MTAHQLPPDERQHPLLEAADHAERAMLGALLFDPARANELIPLLDPRDFTRPVGEVIWETAAELHADGKVPDHPALLAALATNEIFARAGGHQVLLNLRPDIDPAPFPQQHAGIVRRAALHRRAEADLRRARRALDQGAYDTVAGALDSLVEAATSSRETLTNLGAATRHERDIEKEVQRLTVREEANRRHRAAKIAASDYQALFLDRGQLVNLPTPEPLIDRVLPRHAYAVLRGRDHSFKSFVAIDWACCLATGKRWQDHDTEAVRVLYIAGEGAHGLRARIDAWEYAWGRHVPPTMLTVRTAALDLHQPGPAFDHLLDHVTTGDYGLVIVDTLRRVSGAADGNSSEMGAVIDNLDRLKRATTDGTILVVAHTDKGDHDTRGYSGIEDDADVVWAAKRDDMDLQLELTKFKDGADGRTLHLAAQRTLTSLTLADLGGPRAIDTTETQALILDALRIMPTGGVTGPELMATAGIKSRATFYRGLRDLQPHHVTCIEQGRRKYYELTQPNLDDLNPEPPTEATEGHDDPTLPTPEDQ